MGVEIPQPFLSKISGPIGPVTVDGIPDTFHIDIEKLPKIQIGVDTSRDPSREPIQDRLPDIRAHLPADFTVGMSVLGMQLMAIRLCGEAQMIMEPYEAGPCETVGEAEVGPTLTPLPERKG